MIAAGFPFEWLQANFDAIVASLIASGVFELVKAVDWRNLGRIFHAPLLSIKDSFNPYPQSFLNAMGAGTTVEDLAEVIQKAGIDEKYFYLFRLDSSTLEQLARDWSKAFYRVINALSMHEQYWLDKMLSRWTEII